MRKRKTDDRLASLTVLAVRGLADQLSLPELQEVYRCMNARYHALGGEGNLGYDPEETAAIFEQLRAVAAVKVPEMLAERCRLCHEAGGGPAGDMT